MKFWTTKKAAEPISESARAPQVSLNEMVEAVMTLPEIAEAFTRADIELALDDRGWVNLATGSTSITSRELDPIARKQLIFKSRLYWHRDPLAKQAVRLWTDYALGNGVTFNCDDPATQKALNKFWKDRRNRSVLSSEGQRKSSKKCLIDGDVFFAIFNREVVRRIEPLQITEVITEPDDEENVIGFRRLMGDGKTVKFYRNWSATDDDVAIVEGQPYGTSKETVTFEPDVVIYHLPFDATGHFGNGLLFAAVDWSKEHRRFMEARVAITAALAKFAYKMSVKGGQNTINALQARLQSSHVTNGVAGIERNPSNAPGGTFLQNAGIDLAPMPRGTGAGDAKEDGNSLKLMVSAATGIMLHYFGDPSTGNLATATAMELPMLKMFESYQQLWIDAYRDIFSIILDEDPDEEPAVIDIDLPPILADDLTGLSQAVTSITTVFPELKVDEVMQMCLTSLGVNNVDEVMKAAKAQRKKIDAQQQQQDTLMATMAQPKPGAPPLTKESYAELITAFTSIAESLRA